MDKTSSDRVHDWLASHIATLGNGDRLPTVRALMRQHGVGQAAVQAAFRRLKERGQISAEVGRGSFVLRPDADQPRRTPRAETDGRLRSLLILSNASMNERGIRVQNLILDKVRASGGRVVQLSFHDPGHLIDLLHSVPSFDAAILQSHFEVVPLRLLGLLQAKTRALVVDGHSITGVDVDHVGIDWEEAMIAALDHLTARDHRRITLVTLDTLAQPLVHALRYFRRLADWHGSALDLDCVALPDLRHPSQPVGAGLAAAMADIRRNAPTAIVFIGVSDGLGIRDTLASAGVAVPRDLSVVILGHPDVPTEHLRLFTIFGGSSAEAAEQLLHTIQRRLSMPDAPPEIRYLKMFSTIGPSTAAR